MIILLEVAELSVLLVLYFYHLLHYTLHTAPCQDTNLLIPGVITIAMRGQFAGRLTPDINMKMSLQISFSHSHYCFSKKSGFNLKGEKVNQKTYLPS